MKPASSGVKLTYDDLLLLPDDGLRHELIDGEHNVTPSPNVRHQILSGNLHALIRARLDANPVGRVLYAPFDEVFTKFDVVEPDLLYLSRSREEVVLTPANAQGAPELVIEIGSPSTRRRTRPSRNTCTSGAAWTNTGSSIPRSTWCASIAAPKQRSARSRSYTSSEATS